MKNYQNQLDRFRDIAKRLVDDHSADLFNNKSLATNGTHHVNNEVFNDHLNVLGKQLDEQAEQFITTARQRNANDDLKTDIWSVCKKYLDQFVKRNQP